MVVTAAEGEEVSMRKRPRALFSEGEPDLYWNLREKIMKEKSRRHLVSGS